MKIEGSLPGKKEARPVPEAKEPTEITPESVRDLAESTISEVRTAGEDAIKTNDERIDKIDKGDVDSIKASEAIRGEIVSLVDETQKKIAEAAAPEEERFGKEYDGFSELDNVATQAEAASVDFEEYFESSLTDEQKENLGKRLGEMGKLIAVDPLKAIEFSSRLKSDTMRKMLVSGAVSHGIEPEQFVQISDNLDPAIRSMAVAELIKGNPSAVAGFTEELKLTDEQTEELIDSLEHNYNVDALQLNLPDRIRDRLSENLISANPKLLYENRKKIALSESQANSLVENLFLREPDSGKWSNLASELLVVFPSALREWAVGNMPNLPPDVFSRIMGNLSLRDNYSFEDNPEKARGENIGNRLAAMKMLDQLDIKEQQKFLPGMIEHAQDVDFSDPVLSQDLLSRITDEELKEKFKNADSAVVNYERTLSQLREISAANGKRFETDLTKQFGATEVESVIREVRESRFFSINIQFDVIDKILTSGRLKSAIENESSGADYVDSRKRVERLFGIAGKGSEKDPYPIYGAVGGASERSSGAVSQFGNCYIKLNENRIKDRVSLTYGDSMYLADVLPTRKDEYRFGYDDVDVARTALEFTKKRPQEMPGGLSNNQYLEFQVLGGVKAEDIESFHVPQSYRETPQMAALAEKYPNVKFVFVE